MVTIKPPVIACRYWGGYQNHRVIQFTDSSCEYQQAIDGKWITKEKGTVLEIVGKHLAWISDSTGIHRYRDLI